MRTDIKREIESAIFADINKRRKNREDLYYTDTIVVDDYIVDYQSMESAEAYVLKCRKRSNRIANGVKRSKKPMLTKMEEKIAFRLWDMEMRDSMVEAVLTDLEGKEHLQQKFLEWLSNKKTVTTTEILAKVSSLLKAQ